MAVKQGSSIQYFYLLRDYLGNITHVVDAASNVVAEFSFDAWGRRRNATDWHYTTDNEPQLFAGRGFTGHEYLPYFMIYNMNGRLYDPVVGRFLSPDNNVQMPDFTQNFNRYSYALNNPLIYTDPDGEFIFTILAAIFAPPLMPAAVQLDMAWMQGGFSSMANGGNFWSGAGKGFATGLMNAGLSFLNVPGIVPNGLLHAGGNILANGITNSMYKQDFFEGAEFQALTGFAGGAYSGFQIANAEGLNYWWGNEIKYNRSSWSFFNVDKPDYVIDMKIPNVGSKVDNDCVPTTFAEIEAKMGGSRSYQSFTNDPGYTEGKGLEISGNGYSVLIKKTFKDVETITDKAYVVFDPNYMRKVAQNGEVISFHFGGSSSHADNVRKLKVFLNNPMKNKIIFRQNIFNFSQYKWNNNVLNIFRIY